MKKIHPYLYVIALFSFFFGLTSCLDENMEISSHPNSDVLKFNLSLDDFDKPIHPSSRVPASEEQEQTLKNLVFWVFGSNGELLLGPNFLDISSGEAKQTEFYKEEWGITDARKKLQGIHSLHIYSIANYGEEESADYKLISEEGKTLTITKNELQKLTKEEQLQKLGIQLEAAEKGETDITNRPSGYFLRACRQDYTLTGLETVTHGVKAEWVNIHIRRADARLDFEIKPAENVTLSVKKWHVVNLPDRAPLFDRDGEFPKTAFMGSEQDPNWKTPESYDDDTKTYGFTFYALENKQSCPESSFTKELYKNITGEEEPTDPHDRFTNWYLLRERKNKTPNSPVNPSEGKFAVTDGNFLFAPTHSTYIEFIADVSVNKEENFNESGHQVIEHKKQVGRDILFRVHMGAVSPGDGGVPQLGDFNIKRNNRYTYHITVTGLDKIKVEVESNNNPQYGSNNQEKAPGIEGHVVETTNDVLLDSHYGTAAIILNYYSLKRQFYNKEKQKWTLNIRWEMTSPFQQNGHVDEGWCTFYEDGNDYLQDNKGPRRNPIPFEELASIDKSQREKHLFTLTQFQEKIKRDLELAITYEQQGELWKAGFDNITGDKVYTVYLNEFYYDTFPDGLSGMPHITYDGNKDHPLTKEDWNQNGWRSFVNCPARSVRFFIYNPKQFSSDGKSSYTKPDIQISQLAIISPFNLKELPLGYVGWGYEAIDETHNELTNYSSPGTPSANQYTGNVIDANERLYDGRTLWLDERVNYEQFTKKSWWHRENNNGLLDFEEAKRNLDVGTVYPYHYRTRYYQYGPIGRNRDENLNSHIEREELKWYIPSLEQMELICMNDRAIPFQYRMDRKDGDNVPYATSTSDNGSHDYLMVNPLYGTTLRRKVIDRRALDNSIYSYYYGMNSSRQWEGLETTIPSGDRSLLNVRACRQLGMASTADHKAWNMKTNNLPFRRYLYNADWVGSKKYANRDYNTELKDNNLEFSNTWIIDCSSIAEECRRSTLIDGTALPPHTIESEYALPYTAFYVSGVSWKKQLQVTGKFNEAVNNKLNTMIYMLTNYPCQALNEHGITDWRLPNARELQIMSRMIPWIYSTGMDVVIEGGANGWVKGEDNNWWKGYEQLWSGSGQMGYILSSTKTPDGGIFYGADMRDYITGFRVSHPDYRGGNSYKFDLNKLQFDTRCVRDLTPDEIRQLHTTGKINGHKWSDDHYGM